MDICQQYFLRLFSWLYAINFKGGGFNVQYSKKKWIFLKFVKNILLLFLLPCLSIAVTEDQFGLPTDKEVYLYTTDVDYQYEERDINSFLQLRAREEKLDLKLNIIMPSLGDSEDQLESQLKMEYLHYAKRLSKSKIATQPRNILIPVNLTKIHHWVGIVVKLNRFNQVEQINYIDPLGDDIPTVVKKSLEQVYGTPLKIVSIQGLIQTDNTSCGPLTVENIISVAKGARINEHAVIKDEIYSIRDHHLKLAKKQGYKRLNKPTSVMYGGGKTENSVKDLLVLASSSLKVGKLEECIALCNMILANEPTNSMGLYLKCQALLKKNKLEEALTVAELLFTYNPTTNNKIADFLVDNFRQFLEIDSARCINLCKNILDIYPNHLKTLMFKCEAYLVSGEFDQALNLTDDISSKYKKNNFRLYYSKASALFYLEKYPEALEICRLALAQFHQEHPDERSCSPEDVFTLSRIHEYMSEILHRLKEYRKALKNAERSLDYYNRYSHLLGERSFPLDSLFTKGSVLLHMRRLSEARDCFNILLEKSKDAEKSPEIYIGLGYSYFYDKQFKLALEMFEKGHEISPGDWRIAIGLFNSYVSIGTKEYCDRAERLLKKKVVWPMENEVPLSEIALREGCILKKEFNNPIMVDFARSGYWPEDIFFVLKVYIWQPRSDKDYGHAAIKILRVGGKSHYFSWWPSGTDYRNFPGKKRATPPSYGASGRQGLDETTNSKEQRENAARKRIIDLYDGKEPPNIEEQIEYLLLRKSDKEELKRSATYKLTFITGACFFDLNKMIDAWGKLQSSNDEYDLDTLDCCDVVLYLMESSIREIGFDLNGMFDHWRELQCSRDELKPFKCCDLLLDSINAQFDRIKKVSDLANIQTTAMKRKGGSKRKATKSQTVYQYCMCLAKEISKINISINIPPVHISENKWDKKNKRAVKLDYIGVDSTAMLVEGFNPNPHARHTKITSEERYPNLLNINPLDMVFEPISETDEDNGEEGRLIDDLLPEWKFYEPVAEDGNCFFAAVHDQLQRNNHESIDWIEGDDPHNTLRANIQGLEFNPGEWAGEEDIVNVVRGFNVDIAIYYTDQNDTWYGQYNYYHVVNGEIQRETLRALPSTRERTTIMLGYTGNHYLSVLEEGPSPPTATTVQLNNSGASSTSVTRRSTTRNSSEFDSILARGLMAAISSDSLN